jgi:hypothetical protein
MAKKMAPKPKSEPEKVEDKMAPAKPVSGPDQSDDFKTHPKFDKFNKGEK